MTKVKFGYWPRNWSIKTPAFSIEPEPEYDKIVEAVRSTGLIAGNWLYPGLTRVYDPGLKEEERPKAPTQSYSLKPTHELTISKSGDSRKYGEFIISLLGLLEGLRLIPDEWRHFYKMAVKPQTLNDLLCDKNEIERVLTKADALWDTIQPSTQNKLFGAIHWFLFSQSYEHEFEQFGAQYIVLDTCYRIHCEINGEPRPRTSHARRPSYLANEYGILEPSWTSVVSGSRPERCDLSDLRNDYFHEGYYGGDPIGFSHPDNFTIPITLQLRCFNSRLILSILGINSGYTRSAVDTRQIRGLDLDP